MEQFKRLIMQIGKEKFEKLNHAHILLFGLGGVGGNIAETLTRSGVGALTIVDGDTIDITNLNRQIIALHSNIGENKVDVCEKRLLDINPNLILKKYNMRYPNENQKIDFSKFDYVIDAIDDIPAKLEIIRESKKANVPIISAMGAGNKFDPTKIRIEDISKSFVCPLAKKIRKQLKDENITKVKCMYSIETPIKTESTTISSNAFVPAIAGTLIAREVIFDIIDIKTK